VLVATLDVDQQAAFVAQRVLELRGEGVPLEEMAVLYRAHSHSLELQLELTRRGIPFRVRSGVRFFEQTHVKDVLAHLRLVGNPRDELALKRLVKRVPGIGPAKAEALWEALLSLPPELPLAEALVRPEVQAEVPRKASVGFDRFLRLLQRLSQPGSFWTPGQMIQEILQAGGYAEYLRTEFPEEERREDDIRQLAEFAGRFEELPRFLSEIALASEFSAREATGEPLDDCLTLSTVHQSKGLEWRAVFLISLAEGRFPLPGAARTPDEEEEERRLFYVAATRARDMLALSYPISAVLRGGERILLRLSRFIEELPGGDDAPYDRLILETRTEHERS
jgi:DNA helicase-2/ATP-dependent DNA helicase PcrA